MIALIIVGVAVFVLLVGAVVTVPPRESCEQRVRRQVIEADHEIQREYRDARRAMNIAAGQAWRNLTN